MRRSIAILALLLASAGCGTGSTSTPEAGNSQAAASVTKVGQNLRVNSHAGAADVTVKSVTGNQVGKGDIAEKSENGQYVVVDIEIKVIEKSFEVNPLYVKYQAADGKTFDMTAGNAATSGFEPQLGATSVPSGQSVRGVVVFDVPAGKGKLIQFTDELGKIIGSWEI